ncbi:MAG: aminotransferase class I/II-fold pyridoxal phosphate-dependent enzyme [Ruminococcus sp.]|nr:aminotransferase class I/II-fold pyridoxal phosphate-dependent enzyme [Ruminococcus sp.]
MEKLWRKNYLNIEPYTAGEQPKTDDIIKLNANENPYPPSYEVYKTIAEFEANDMRKYPLSDSAPLRAAIAEHCSNLYGARLTPDNIFVGNGSDDVLAAAFRAFFNSDKPVMFPDITYSFYPVWCELMKIPFVTVPVDDKFMINPEDYAPENGGVVIANPNAPTSIGMGLDSIRRILDLNQDCIVIVDEAYVDFGGESAVKLLSEYENLLVTQTFSKSRSMAGMRIAMAYGSTELISMLNAVKDSYNSYPLDRLAIATGIASVGDEEYLEAITSMIIATREKTAAALRKLGFDVPQSSTNFLFVQHKTLTAKRIFEYTREKGIYIRYWDKPRINNRLRITIGTNIEMSKLIAALEELIAAECK